MPFRTPRNCLFLPVKLLPCGQEWLIAWAMSKKDKKIQRHGSKPLKSAKKTGRALRRDGLQNSSREYRKSPASGINKDLWFFGRHPVLAALNNTGRQIKRLLVTKRSADQYRAAFSEINQDIRPLTPEIVPLEVLEKVLPADCLHQGIALQTNPLPEVDLEKACTIEEEKSHLLLILDQVTDPHNVGAIIRSAAAFGSCALISTDRHSPPESGTLAKSASGALEALPWVRVTNLSRTLAILAEMGYWRLGLDGTADISIRDADFGNNIALVMGAEGKGLRKGTIEHCDSLIKLPVSRAVESLNVSNAAAIALYEFSK